MVRPWLYSIIGLVGFLIGTYLLIMFGLPIVLPFFVALIVAELLDPIVQFLTWKGRVPRGIAVGLVLFLFVGLFTTAITIAVARLVEEIEAAIIYLPNLYNSALILAEEFSQGFGSVSATLPESVHQMLTDNIYTLMESVKEMLPGVVGTLGMVSSVPMFIANLLVALIATFFISRDRRIINDFLLSLFPSVWRPKLRKVKVDVWASTMGFAKAQAMLIAMTMIQSMFGLWLIGANYWVMMGVIVGVADVLPLLGPATIFIPWIVYNLIFGSKIFALKLLVLYAVLASVRQVLEAKVLGEQLGLHPLAVLVSLYMGFQFFGALGFIVGPILAILLKSMINSGLLPIFQEDSPPKA